MTKICRKKIPLLCAIATLLALAAPAEAGASRILGQVLTEAAFVDGLPVPAGTTLFDGNLIGSATYPSTIHLSDGQLVEISRNSSAVLKSTESGEVRLHVLRGTVSFRESSGEVATLAPDSEAVFAQRRAGEPIRRFNNGVVAVIAPAGNLQRAEKGQNRVPVNDSSKIQPTSEALLQTSLSRTEPVVKQYVQEVTCSIEDIRDNIVRLSDDLAFTYEPGDHFIQGSKIPESKVVTKLKRPSPAGDDLLDADDSKAVNPLQRIVLRTPDRRVREVACVRYTDEDVREDADDTLLRSVVKLVASLENSFVERSDILQGKQFDTERTVTKLSHDADNGQATLRVLDPAAIDPLQQVMIRSVDRQLFEAYCVRYIKDDLVVLAENLDHEYPEGSEIIQGRSSQELIASGVALQRTANCCCCCDTILVPPVILARDFNPWWLILGGAGAGGAISTGGGGGPPPPIPPPASQIVP